MNVNCTPNEFFFSGKLKNKIEKNQLFINSLKLFFLTPGEFSISQILSFNNLVVDSKYLNFVVNH
jgi:hypothetical protein